MLHPREHVGSEGVAEDGEADEEFLTLAEAGLAKSRRTRLLVAGEPRQLSRGARTALRKALDGPSVTVEEMFPKPRRAPKK